MSCPYRQPLACIQLLQSLLHVWAIPSSSPTQLDSNHADWIFGVFSQSFKMRASRREVWRLCEISPTQNCAPYTWSMRISYRSTFDWERTLAAKLFVSSEYLLLCSTREAISSITTPVCFDVERCESTLAASDFWIFEVLLLVKTLEAFEAIELLLVFRFIIFLHLEFDFFFSLIVNVNLVFNNNAIDYPSTHHA